jgi:hypothetical protein
MKTVNFVLGLHNHQPVGNLGHVFEEAYDKAYKPFLDVLERHPKIRVSLHYTGPLFQWLADNRPELVDRLRGLVERNQAEMMTGGFYEPILGIIPENDRVAQIKRLTEYVKEKTGADATGMWVAERVWEPHLAGSVHKAGVRYIVLDDSHFKATGIAEDKTHGYYCTEDQGQVIAAFPISEKMRYLIPFEKPEKTIEYLKELGEKQPGCTVVMADDGEKFGVWPKTYKHCYEKGWLEAFFSALESEPSINVVTFSDVLKGSRPLGRVYLPTASYMEMMEWAMPAKSILNFESFLEKLKADGTYEDNKTFVRGGFWTNFFAKYEESNHMHKRMLSVSKRLQRLEGEKAKNGGETAGILRQAREHLMAGQCNCAYWHGVFGGLYLSNLRHGVYENLVRADAEMDKAEHGDKPFVAVEEADFLADMRPAVLVQSDRHFLAIKPDQGGQIIEHDWKPASVNLTNTLTRRFEAYHKKVKQAISPEEADKMEGTASIHDIVISKEKNLENILHYDWHRRSSLVDHFLGEEATLDNFMAAQYPEKGNFANMAYEYQVRQDKDGAAEVVLWREGRLFPSSGPKKVRVEKTIRVAPGDDVVRVDYVVANQDPSPIKGRFGVEYVINFMAPDAPDRYFLNIERNAENILKNKGVQQNAAEYGLADEWLNAKVQFVLDGPAPEVWRVPIDTVSLSEAGFERGYQGTSMMPVWPIELQPGQSWKARLEIRLSHAKE